MKPKKNPSTMRNPKGSSQAPTSGNPYAPSVPISVYRELAAELQATKAMLDSLNTQNQELTHQNQLLRQEVERFVQSTLHLQQATGIAQPALQQPAMNPVRSTVEAGADPRFMGTGKTTDRNDLVEAETMASKLRTQDFVASEELFTEQKERRPQTQSSQAPKDMGGLWLTLTIVAIIITAFGAGFLVVRPLIPQR